MRYIGAGGPVLEFISKGCLVMCEECEEEYEYCSKCPHCIVLSKITQWTVRFREHILKTYCKVKGHKFEDVRELKELYNGRIVIQQRCRCFKVRYIYADTREVMTSEEVSSYYGIMIIEILCREANIYSMLPKKPWLKFRKPCKLNGQRATGFCVDEEAYNTCQVTEMLMNNYMCQRDGILEYE